MFRRTRDIYRAEAVERLSSPDDLDEMIAIVAPRDSIALVVLGSLLAIALAWAIFGHLTTSLSLRGILVGQPREDRLIGLAYVPVAQGRRIRAGMPVQISPDDADRQRFGGITGTVSSVSAAPVTLDHVSARVGHGDTARELLRRCPCLEVVAALDVDPTTSSGYRWSGSRGPNRVMIPGMTTTVRVTIDRRRPISHLLPVLRNTPEDD